MQNRCSEFLYHPIGVVEAYAMRQWRFKELLSLKPATHMKTEIYINYKYGIQEPVMEHREEQSKKFKL
jgi:hypothetical protein